MCSAAQWTVLARLFADEDAPFRHHLGLSRSGAPLFYAPTAEAASIRCQKQEILDSTEADEYLFESAEGWPAFQEFVTLTGCDMQRPAGPSTEKTDNRAATSALEPDFILLVPGAWTMVWASVCFPTRWSLAGKGLQPIAGIHAIVPGLNAELGRKIDVFFARLEPGDGWSRANWGLSTSAERNQHPLRPYVLLANDTPLARVYLRVESQHLFKLPGTGAIAFGIRILNFPLEAVAKEPGFVAGLTKRLRTMPAEVAAYKGIPAEFWRRL
jgi:hypothetical protein